MPRHRSPLSACLLLAALGALGAGEPTPGPVLHLKGGGYVPGRLGDSEGSKVLRWQGSAFTEPFDFRLGAVEAVHVPVPKERPKAVGDFRVELGGGDVVFGNLVGLDDGEAVIESARLGTLHVKRGVVRRVERWGDNPGVVYLGPNGLSDWHESGVPNAWHEESGSPVTDKDGASLRVDLGIPARAAFEVELSWKSAPDFVLALGVTGDAKSSAKAFRFEVWDGDLVALRESEKVADLAPLGTLAGDGATGPGRVYLRAYLDQEKGRLVVFSAKGERLADLTVGGDNAGVVSGGLLLENRHGDVRLDRLRVSRWGGDLPSGPRDDGADIQLTDGSSIPGRVLRYDAEARAFVVREGDEKGNNETRVPRDKVSRLTLPPAAGEDDDNDLPPPFAVMLQDGTRLSGEPLKVSQGELWLKVPGVKEAAHLPTAEFRSLAVTPPPEAPIEVEKSLPRLELDGVRLSGQLADGRERTDASCLVWRPNGSETASPLRPGASGRIYYKEPKPKTPAPTQVQVGVPGQIRILNGQGVFPAVARMPGQGGGGGAQGFLSGFAGTGSTESKGRRSMYLRTGDVITTEVTGINEEGVTFRSPMSDKTFVPHDKVKAVELAPPSPSIVGLNKPKRERLLTVPRVQKGSPPTHLIRSKNGDYLRGRVVGLDAKTLKVEVRLETKDVPRDRISRIIWFHADETDPPKAPPSPPSNGPTRVQVVRGDGVRLTFRAERLTGVTLSGTSDVLGPCRVRLDEADEVVFGGAVDQESARLAYRQWKLQNAPEPKITPEGDEGGEGRSPGTESALVGKPAPDFTLGLLSGETFHLADSKGKEVVVLDFWATWCGPCIQAMPQVEGVAKEFRDQGVRLVAVNLQEAPAVISAMLERHKFTPTVALDRDGAVGEKYRASAIPQTVVIDRDGNVARLFVGGGPHLGEKLRDALKALQKPAEPKK